MPSPSSSPGLSATGAWLCHTGRMRRANEDSCLAGAVLSQGGNENVAPFAVEGQPWIVAVADGIGGHRGGAAASHAVVEALAHCRSVTPVGVRELLKDVSRELCERGRAEPELAGMGATVAGVASGPEGLFAFSVGDSRVYKYARRRLTQITRDDSEAEELVRAGFLKRDEVRPGNLHALTQAIGGRTFVVEIRPHVYPLKVATRARFLICSDGLTDMLSQTILQDTMAAESDATGAAAHLFQLAMDAGGLDNITLAVVEVAAER